MILIFKIGAFFFMTLALVSCSQPSPIISSPLKTIPSWYINPPLNTQMNLYAVGEGTTFKEAQNRALESMIAELGISVSSSYESNLEVRKSTYEYFVKDTTYKVNTEVSKIRINNYKVLKRNQYKYNSFLVLVSTDKMKFIKALKKELHTKVQFVNTSLKGVENLNSLARYEFYEKSLATLKTMFPNILVLNSLEANYDESSYQVLVSEITELLNTLKNEMTFSLKDRGQAKGFKEELLSAMTKDDKKVIRDTKTLKNHINIEIEARTKYLRSHGFDISRTVLIIQIKDNQGKLIGGNKLDLVGRATQGQDIALNEAVKSLHQLILKEGINKVLGL